jgi:hypothetical protein
MYVSYCTHRCEPYAIPYAQHGLHYNARTGAPFNKHMNAFQNLFLFLPGNQVVGTRTVVL